MKQKLIIIGAGSVGKFIVYNQNSFTIDFEIVGILDDDCSKHNSTIAEIPVLGSIDKIKDFSDQGFALVWGIAFPTVKQNLFDKYKELKFDYPNFVSVNAWISQEVRLGKGCIIYPGCSINYETVIEDFVVMNMNCAIGHNCSISSFTSLSPGVNLGGNSKIGTLVELGIGCATLQGITIADHVKVGGQAMVTKNIKSYKTVKGIPAK